MYSAGRQNLAAALNDPHHRDLGLFTRTWGEAFVPTTPIPPSTTPVVSKDDFMEYLKRTREVGLPDNERARPYYFWSWVCYYLPVKLPHVCRTHTQESDDIN